jgi:hypothetical protein
LNALGPVRLIIRAADTIWLFFFGGGMVHLSQNFSGLSVYQVQARAGLARDSFVLVIGHIPVVIVPAMLNLEVCRGTGETKCHPPTLMRIEDCCLRLHAKNLLILATCSSFRPVQQVCVVIFPRWISVLVTCLMQPQAKRRGAASITNPARGTLMALFKELTDAEGNNIIVNLDAARFMQRITDATTKIYFGNDDAVKVKETPAEILMLTAL